MDHWLEKRHRGRNLPSQKTLREYFERNVYVTTAGDFSTPGLLHALKEIGITRVLFSVDTLDEKITEGATWLDTLPISHDDVAEVGRMKALELFPVLKDTVLRSETAKVMTDRKRVLLTTTPGSE
jgi:predicted TIM-barrel fold metal-dependent hydrolase